MKVIGLDHRTRGLTGSRLVTMGGRFFWVTGRETAVDLNMTTTGTATETGIFITSGTARIRTTTARLARRAMTEFMVTAQRLAFSAPDGFARGRRDSQVHFQKPRFHKTPRWQSAGSKRATIRTAIHILLSCLLSFSTQRPSLRPATSMRA